MRIPSVCAALVALAAASACGRSEPSRVEVRSAALVALEGCDEVAAGVKARAIADMDARIDANLERALVTQVCAMRPPGVIGIDVPQGAAPAAAADAGSETGPSARSGTNDQVAGVDEPDLVKSDGTHLFLVADERFQVLAAWPAAETRRIASLALPGAPKRLLLDGDRAVVFSSLPLEGEAGGPPVPIARQDWPPECTYGYDCVPRGDGRPLAITVVDVSDRAAPRVVREVRLSGSYLAARRIGDAVHVVATAPAPVVFEGLDHGESLLCREPRPERVVRAEFEALRARNRALIEAVDVSGWLPTGSDARGTGAERVEHPLQLCDRVYAAPEAEGAAFLSVASFALSSDDALEVTTVLGQPGVVYAAPESLYVAAPQRWRGGGWWFWPDPVARAEATTVHAFALRASPAPAADYLGSGVVPGRVLNQLSLDEHGGALRVATTIGRSPDPAARSAVTVLRHAGGALEEVGRVDGIAPGEDIRAVRFDGDRGFVVTFRATDPLFAIDLVDPAAPRVAGELHVPGFSTYMHLMDPAHLLTIGFDVVDDGTFAFFQGLRLQVFDVADLAAPALSHVELVGSRGSGSQAASDHLAFNYFAPKDLLAIPATVCTEPSGPFSAPQVDFSGLLVYRVTTAAGFEHLGGVAHPLDPQADPWSACGGWWTRSSSLVKRSLFADEYVYSLTPRELRVQDTRALGADVARVDLGAP